VMWTGCQWQPVHRNWFGVCSSTCILAIPTLLLSFGFFYAANKLLHLPLSQMQTLIFVMLVFTG
jgi:ABC-type Fe3+ transport system permease subunit